MTIALLPCPFCGGTKVSVKEGTTYGWEYATCDECGAQAGEVRRSYPQSAKDSEVIADAIAEWNVRDRREIDALTRERDEARDEAERLRLPAEAWEAREALGDASVLLNNADSSNRDSRVEHFLECQRRLVSAARRAAKGEA